MSGLRATLVTGAPPAAFAVVPAAVVTQLAVPARYGRSGRIGVRHRDSGPIRTSIGAGDGNRTRVASLEDYFRGRYGLAETAGRRSATLQQKCYLPARLAGLSPP